MESAGYHPPVEAEAAAEMAAPVQVQEGGEAQPAEAAASEQEPTEAAAEAAAPGEGGAAHPWISGYSAEGHLYYYNTRTGEASWTMPEEMAAAEAAAQAAAAQGAAQ